MSIEVFLKSDLIVPCNPSNKLSKLDLARMMVDNGLEIDKNPIDLQCNYMAIKNEILRKVLKLNNHQAGLYQVIGKIKLAIIDSISNNQKLNENQKLDIRLKLFEVSQDSLKIEIDSIKGSENKLKYTARVNPTASGDLFFISYMIEIDGKNRKVIFKDIKVTLSEEAANYLGTTISIYELPEISYSLDEMIKLKPDKFALEYIEENVQDLNNFEKKLIAFLKDPENKEKEGEFNENLLTLYKNIGSVLGDYKPSDLTHVLHIIFKKIMKNNETDDFMVSSIPLFDRIYRETKDIRLRRLYAIGLDAAREAYPLSSEVEKEKVRLCSELDAASKNHGLFFGIAIELIKEKIENFFDHRLFCSETATSEVITNIQNHIEQLKDEGVILPVELDLKTIESALRIVRCNYIFKQSWREEENKLYDLVDSHCKDSGKTTELYSEIRKHMQAMEKSLHVVELNENAIEQIIKLNNDFIARIKLLLKSTSEATSQIKICLSSLQLKSTQPFIHKVIQNVSRKGDELAAKGKGPEAVVKKGMVQNLVKKSNEFYQNTETIDNQTANRFFQGLKNEIKEQETNIDASDKTDVGILSLLYEKIAPYVRRGDYIGLARDCFSSMFGFFENKESQKDDYGIIETISKQALKFIPVM